MNDVVKKRSRSKKIAIIVGGVILVGALAHTWAGDRSHWQNGHRMNYMVEHVGNNLDLDDGQRAQLESLSNTLMDTKRAMHNGNEHALFLASIEGVTLNQFELNALITNKLDMARAQTPQIIASLAEFYDSLTPEQQQQVRERLAKMAEHRNSRHQQRD